MHRHHWFLALTLTACTGTGGKDETVETDLPAESDTELVVDTADTARGDTGLGIDWPDTPADYTFSEVTYLSSFTLPVLNDTTGPGCCRDWGEMSRDFIRDGTDKRDNALATMAKLAQDASSIDVQAQLDASIRTGLFVGLLDHLGIPEEAGSYHIAFLVGEFDELITWWDASAGEGEFLVHPESFVPGSGRPRVVFPNVSLEDGHLQASGAGFDLPVPLVGATLLLPLQDVLLDADVSVTPTGVSFTDAALSGYVSVDDLFAAYNDVVRRSCGCAGVSGDLFRKAGGTWSGECGSAGGVAASCPGDNQSLCVQLVAGGLGGFCGLLPAFVPQVADLDLDGDERTFEALSVGLVVDGVPASVTGLSPN